MAVGWTHPVLVRDGLQTGRFAFDRLLGANVDADWGKVKSPKERPRNWTEVFDEIHALGKGSSTDKGLTAQLDFVGSDQILAPSIATIDVEEIASQFVLHGAFGTDSGDHKVTLASTPDGDGPEIRRNWQPDTVKCNVDGEQAGYVRAFSHGHKSNPIAVTRFHPVFTWHMTGGTDAGGKIDETAVMDIILRVDVQAYRRHSKEEPLPRDPFRVAPSKASKCKFTTTGYGVAHGEKTPINGSTTGEVIGPYPSVLPPSAASNPMSQFLGQGSLPNGLPAISGIPALPAGMPDPQLFRQAPMGTCLFGGILDPKVGTTFAASITLPNVIKVAGHEVPGVFTTAMFGKKGQNMTDEIKNLTLNMKIDPPSRPPTRDGEQGGAVTLKGDTLTQPQKGGDITLQWGDAPGDFPPDKTSAR